MNLSFFDGVEFPLGSETPRRTGMWRNHPVHFGIQYSHDAPVHILIDGHDLGFFEGPHAFLTIPGHVYDYGTDNGAYYHHAFICTFGPRTAQYRATGLMSDTLITPVRIQDGHRFLTTLRDLFPIVLQPGPPPPRAVLMLEDLLLQMHEAHELAQGARNDRASVLASLEARLLAHPEFHFNFGNEAERIGLTLTHFRRLFREKYGVPPQQFLIRCRLQRAAVMLTSTTLSVKEIAQRCGFESSEYFTRLFHQKYHLAPHSFRTMHN
ncbi:MAG: helix-turn-helix transcriptional regulator [Victivallales bacterium]|nr:helix-turn-helix transcriptional regulator [Victivallales bacterium]